MILLHYNTFYTLEQKDIAYLMPRLKIKHEIQTLKHFALCFKNFCVYLIYLSFLVENDILLLTNYGQFDDIVEC